ncbi:STAS domain-containing protein [Streptomyces sudanensis]|uniref:STAS domain-containing protein n=1 Tax=Streptomyces sudanensis TaxID=436397 RepID=UPI0020CD0049|nr:STAS domain-containing protein [Streptomyces sudanensis]MCP9957598.1 STAS domain-containing protein [Streptomyces sudanensis]MCQ0001859.1 STAS domain-containing protein [Streptomyces sudanensis]
MKDTEPIVLRVGGPVGPADARRLCGELTALLDRAAPGAAVVVDAARLTRPDLAAVDALARLHLTARRRGHPLTVRDAGPGLRALLSLAGLADRLLSPPGDPGGRTAGTTAPRPGTT